jgi:hypothetical protein
MQSSTMIHVLIGTTMVSGCSDQIKELPAYGRELQKHQFKHEIHLTLAKANLVHVHKSW